MKRTLIGVGNKARRSKTMRLVSLAALAISTVLVPSQTPATATNFTGANGQYGCSNGFGPVNMQDANPHTYYYGGLEGPTSSAMEWARVNRIHPTRIDTQMASGLSSTTDVVALDEDYATTCLIDWHPVGTTWAYTTCLSLTGAACERHDIRFDLSAMNTIDQNGKNVVACHEQAHTLGLTHRSEENGCIKTPFPYAGELTLHDVTHINGATWIKPDYNNPYIWNGQIMRSYDGRYQAGMQSDGNFVVRGPAGGPCDSVGVCWASGTDWAGSSTFAVIQGDGNFVIYMSSSFGNTPICNSRTNGHPGSTVEMQNDGNLVVYFPGHIPGEWSESPGGICS